MVESERENEVAMYLARRAYVYSLMHLVFGNEPNEECVSKIFAQQTHETAQVVSSMLCEERFAALAAESVGAEELNLKACVDETVAGIAESVERGCNEGFRSLLASDYTKLFLVPGDSGVRVWESSYIGRELMLFQESTLDVRAYYHAAGFKLQAERRFPDDHIAAMMDFMGRMGQRAYEAFADGSDAEAADDIAASADFARNHILTWVDGFAWDVVDKDPHGYYAAFACLMAAFAHMDIELAGEISTLLASGDRS